MKLERVDAWRWRIPPDARPGMRVPGIIFADDALMEDSGGRMHDQYSVQKFAAEVLIDNLFVVLFGGVVFSK